MKRREFTWSLRDPKSRCKPNLGSVLYRNLRCSLQQRHNFSSQLKVTNIRNIEGNSRIQEIVWIIVTFKVLPQQGIINNSHSHPWHTSKRIPRNLKNLQRCLIIFKKLPTRFPGISQIASQNTTNSSRVITHVPSLRPLITPPLAYYLPLIMNWNLPPQSPLHWPAR